jgi:hypothetical protein
MSLVTIPNVEICSTGTWMASTGQVTFTEDDLTAALAATEDPAVKEPRLIIGHTDGTAPPGMSPNEGFFGEQPCLGRFTNLRLAENNQTLMGDLIGVPQWLADILPTAYPNRSIEGYWDVVSATGKEHGFIIPRVALLGVNLPAVATLEDLQAMFSEEGPEGVTLTKVGERVAANRPGERPTHVAASVQYEDVRRDFYQDFAEGDRYWWWIRAVYVDPPILIVDDDEGGLWSVPYSVAGDSAEFGEPIQVITQYVEKDSGKVAASKPHTVGHQYTKAESRPADRQRPNKEAQMARVSASIDVSALRSRLGLTEDQLPDDATEDQINEALTTPAPGTSPDPAVTAHPDQPEAGTPEAGALQPGEPSEGGANRGSLGPGQQDDVNASGRVVDAETLAQLQRDAAAGREARAEQLRVERTAFVSAAVSDGRIPPTRRDHYLTLMERDDAGTREFLNSLTPGASVPTGELGHGESVDASASEYIDTHLSPEERNRIALARQGQSSPDNRIITEA